MPRADNEAMTIATPERYAEMLEAARRGGYAYPAINVTSSQTLNAALKGFADAESDGHHPDFRGRRGLRLRHRGQ